ncbi:MAG: branched-chain amino acid ABC transporter permease [Nocardioidaceae bacterium]|nr:branched-chain amino acid ABC transporter permease [Nocardioidaceae bacterium]
MRKRLTAIGLLLFACLALVLIAAPAAGADVAATASSPSAAETCKKPPQRDDDTIHIVGCLTDTRDDPPSPVEGVKLTVVDEAGKKVAEGTSDATGRFDLKLPGTAFDVLGNTYTVEIDPDTFPEGSYLTNPGDIKNQVHIQIDTDIAINYDIGPDVTTDDPLWDQALDNLISGLFAGLLLAVAAIGLSLVFGTTGLTNFAHGELISFGALAAFLFNAELGLHTILAGILAVLVSAAFGFGQDVGLWKPLRKRGTGIVAMMIITIGLSIFLRNVYQYFIGADAHQYTDYTTVVPWEIGSVSITPKDLLVALVCVIVLVVVSLAVQLTRLGKATRAVSDNPALAASSGINVDLVITVVWTVGTALAGLAGFLFGLTQGLDYQVGFKLLLLVFAAVTLGGLGSIWGAMIGGVLIGLLIEVSTLWIPSELKYVGALVVLILVLLVRPQGLLGRPERVG